MLEQSNWSVFTEGIIVETAAARQMLADVEARHNDIVKLEKSLQELHDMFLEMAVLIEAQGEVVDRIQNHVEETKDFVQEAKVQLVKAEKLQGSARRKKIYIIIFLILLVIVIGLIIYFT